MWLCAQRERAQSSFMYLGPTCFGYSRDFANPDAEADLLVLVDGESFLFEVKSAWRSLRGAHVQDFIDQAKRIRPDRAVLAVMEEGKRLVKEISEAESELNGLGIKFELLTPSSYAPHDGPHFLEM